MVGIDDFQDFEGRLRREIDKIDQYQPEDQPAVRRFIAAKDGRIETSTLAEYLSELRLASSVATKPISEFDKFDLDDFTFQIRHDPDLGHGGGGVADSTARNRQKVIRIFLKTIRDGGEGTDWLDDYEPIRVSGSTVSEEDILTSEDIKALRDGANNLRDVALIEFLADTGMRISLAASLRVRDVDLEGDAATFRPNPNASGLKGADIKDYPLIDSPAVLRTYLQSTHPRPDDSDVAFFHKIPGHGYRPTEDDDGAPGPTTINEQLTRAAELGGVDKPVNPHNFRHSAITRMSREGYTRSQIEHRVCWTIDSSMWSNYEHISSAQHNDDIFAAAGIIESDDGPDSERHPCGNCKETLAPHHEYCPRCGQPATPETRNLQQEAVGDVTADIPTLEDEAAQDLAVRVAQELNIDARHIQQSPSSSE
ncbi:tyrosine-type recombinase/integrase [Halocalculus aciditolerans]|uniref:Tyr recombinase domain-containing protein n=1 Tax=Halocalculus aciditolerans TaxID=1383812 RepID=A0A830FAB3_9EURY|nr:tyrosine-type recombinase/integrase [Halocalculus aciditolerans]GGL55414.1 hypothetical protein GCM10009039_11940 [Halocalculus aciditolerans]